jgi:serine/threonine protein phosphatase PrpC
MKNVSNPFTFVQASNAHQDHPERNEDYQLIDSQHGMAVICDGVGSAIGADMAAHIAARIVKKCWRCLLSQPTQASSQRTMLDLNEALRQMLEEANNAVLALGKRLLKNATTSDDNNKNAGYAKTTIALMLLYPQNDSYIMAYAHAGDSRIYLSRTGKALQRLTIDDGYFLFQQNKGELDEPDALRIEQSSSADQLTEEERKHFDKRNGIMQSLGDKCPVFHIGQIELYPEDRILLCTDGIHDNLTDTEIAEILHSGKRTTVAKQLVQHALTRSQQDVTIQIRAKKDDMSAVVVTCHFAPRGK